MGWSHAMNFCTPPSCRTSLNARTQIQVIGVVQQNLHAEFFESVLRNAFNCANRADRHEDRRLHLAMGREETSRAGKAVGGFNLEAEGHSSDCSGTQDSPLRHGVHGEGQFVV